MLHFPSKYNFNGVQALNFIHGLHRILLYSTSSSSSSPIEANPTSSSLANYLIESLGFSDQESLSTATKISHIRTRRGTKSSIDESINVINADSVINFFKQYGFDLPQIRKVVISHPLILFSRAEKTLQPKFKLLQDVGLSGSDLVHVISNNPLVLDRSLNLIQSLKTVLGSDENVVRIVRQSNFLYSSFGNDNVIKNFELLESYGIPSDKIQKHMFLKPRPFLMKTCLLQDILIRVEEKLGIPRDTGMFLYGVQLLSGISDRTIDSKCRVFESFGWTKSNIEALIRRNPLCLTLSEAKITKALEFLMNELGYDPARFVACPALLTASLEKRLMPRYRILQILREKGLLRADYPLYKAVNYPESQFLVKFVQSFKDDVPNLHEIYVTTRDTHKVPAITGEEHVELLP